MNPSEYQEQVMFTEWLDMLGLAYFHVPNSTWTTSWKQKSRNRALGVQAGVPDLFVIIPNKGLIAIEMKRIQGSTTSQAQRYWIDTLNALPGCEAFVCKGAGAAMKTIEKFLPKDMRKFGF